MRGPLQAHRVRSARATTYGWIDHRLRPWLRLMATEEHAVYLFLVLAADAHGVSWYRHESIGRALSVDPAVVRRAVAGLERLDLVAYRAWREDAADGVFQVLSVPASTPATAALPAQSARAGGARSLASLLPQAFRRSDAR